MNPKVKRLKEYIEPYHSLIAMIIFFAGLLGGIYKLIVRPPNLAVSIHNQSIEYPSTINSKFESIYKFISDSVKKDVLLKNAKDINEYLLYTSDYWEIKFTNETSTTIKGIQLRITKAASLNASTISSSFFLEEEAKQISKNIHFEKQSGVILLNQVPEIPPKAEVSIFLWGKIPSMTYNENVYVTYDGGEAKPENEITVSGFKAYLVDYIYELLILLFLVFIILYRNQLKKYENAINKTSTSNVY